MAKKEIVEIVKKDFQFLKENVLGVVIYGSVAKGEETSKSDIDVCVISPKTAPKDVLKLIYRKINVNEKKYDVKVFEELPLFLKMEVIKSCKVLIGDPKEINEYFYKFRKLWNSQKHRQEVSKEDIKKILTHDSQSP